MYKERTEKSVLSLLMDICDDHDENKQSFYLM